ncbi:hypothetical protein C7999DRAFT_43820 [Corynascus novoguineensis]|uniref:Uncharacterized protein n=1 Tax=Corynascus novoguineensis TaxID=1126955 RepID=A0AAN7HJN6_9PEZI|nr:hypothetical protein C7999DRAFT_43820 [Corynascus novoguineensis]
MSLGAVQVPLDSLEFPDRRQISFKVRERPGRVFRNLSKAGATEVRIPCTVEEGKGLPLLPGVTLSCLYSDYLVVAAKGNKETSLIVHLFSADLLDPLLELISAFSYKPQQSDRELYQKIVESYYHDEVTYTLYIGSLTGPKERNIKMFLRPKNLPILALYIDKQVINYLNHISVSLDINSIRIVQFRMPTVCSGDVDTIKRLFDNGTLFPRVTDSSDTDILRRNVLSLDMVIPSFETFQENMHYVGLAAKILIRHVVDELLLCKSSRKRSPTIFEVLSNTYAGNDVDKEMDLDAERE